MDELRVMIGKSNRPIIFLDSNIIIQMKRAIDGTSSEKRADSLRQLYETLIDLIHRKLIYCPFGSQHEEIGASRKKQSAEDFFLEFANSTMLFPTQIKNHQLDKLYEAYLHGWEIIEFPYSSILKANIVIDGRFTIRVRTAYDEEQLRRIKEGKVKTAELVTALCSSGVSKSTFEEQLCEEFTADIQLIKEAMRLLSGSPDDLSTALNIWGPIYSRIGYQPGSPDFHQKLSQYLDDFMYSIYGLSSPYDYVSSNLSALRTTSGRKFIPSDAQDTANASAYLPYVNYFVTDQALCTLIKELKLDSNYGTKVYSMRDLDLLIADLTQIGT